MVYIYAACKREVGRCYGDSDYCDDCAAKQILEEERHNLSTCFKFGRFGHSDEFTVSSKVRVGD